MPTMEIYIRDNKRDYVEKRGSDRYEVSMYVRDINSEEGRRRLVELVNRQRSRDGESAFEYNWMRQHLQNIKEGATIKFYY